MGQIETMWWGGSEPLCGYVCGWLIDEMLSLRRGSMMMAITRGWELRRSLLLGVQARVLTALLLKFVFLLFGQVVSACDGYCLLLYLMDSLVHCFIVISPQLECDSSVHSLHCPTNLTNVLTCIFAKTKWKVCLRILPDVRQAHWPHLCQTLCLARVSRPVMQLTTCCLRH